MNYFCVNSFKSFEKGDKMLYCFEFIENIKKDKYIIVNICEYLNLKGQVYLEAGKESEDFIV